MEVRKIKLNQYSVGSASVPGRYYTVYTFEGRAVSCTCPQYEYRQKECKHIQAVSDEVRSVVAGKEVDNDLYA